MLHVFVYGARKGGSFLVVAGTESQGMGDDIEAYKGLSRRMPFLAFSMLVFLLSLAGIPPMGGFFAKFVLFSSAVRAASFNEWYLALAVSGVLNSALSLYYYARVIWYMYPGTGARGGEGGGPLGDPSVGVHRPLDRHADRDPRGVLPRVPDRRGPRVLRLLALGAGPRRHPPEESGAAQEGRRREHANEGPRPPREDQAASGPRLRPGVPFRDLRDRGGHRPAEHANDAANQAASGNCDPRRPRFRSRRIRGR